uniref:Ctf8, putative n=1 Tax=Theileria annulata TaxID=5874 RepID=A0A3B0MP79_THEAN
MLSETVCSLCRSNEFSNQDNHNGRCTTPESNNHLRYKILSFGSEFNKFNDKKSLNLIKILDLSGDVDKFSDNCSIECEEQNEDEYDINKSTFKKNSYKEEPSVEFKPIQNCFKRKDGQTSEETVSGNEEEESKIWGKINGNLNGLFSNKEESSDNEDSIYLTIGPYVLQGKKVETRAGENFVILRKVPNHCSCICSDSNSHCNHIAYYEICGVVNQKIEFKSRPIIYYTADDNQSDEYYLYQSNFINTNWLILSANDEILNNMLDEQAYFKIINNDSEKNKKAVLCILNNTYYIERIELGGTILLYFPMAEVEEAQGDGNLLVIIGSSKYSYNLIRSNPIFENLPKTSNIHMSSLLDQTPISDLEISDYILGKNEMYPSYYLYQQDGTLRYMGHYFFGEFTIRIIEAIPIYFSKYPDKKKKVTQLTVGEIWDMVNSYPDIFDFVPQEVRNLSTLFQTLLKISDVEQTFTTLDECISVAKSEMISELNVKLNLFKMQKLISWCIVSANCHSEINYYQYTRYLDNILFNKAFPSYIFDDLIEYMLSFRTDNEQFLDYLKSVEYYYKKMSFSEVSNLFSDQNSTQANYNKTFIIFDKSGTELFMMNELDIVYSDLYKLPCLNYEVFKNNTKGLTQLRFSYSMNSLLHNCRSPLSLHISFLAEKVVAILDSNRCVLKIYPTVKHEGLRDNLSELFKLKRNWHLEVLENKLKHFFKDKPAIDMLTGGPDYHGRLWITKEKNNRNYVNQNVVEEIKNETVNMWKKMDGELKSIKEESYIIINWNVPT